MRSLLLAFLVGLAVASNVIEEQAFRPRVQYLYKYESQIQTSLNPGSRQNSGYKLSTSARVQFITASRVRVELKDIILYKIDQPVIQIEPDVHTLPSDFLKEFVGPDARTVIQYLQIPFSFTYDNGHVMDIALDDRETSWSANTKRAFASLFEVNLQKRLLLEDSVQPAKIKYPPHTSLYTVLEQSPTGDCATQYAVQPISSEGRISVGKVRDFGRCIAQPGYFKSPFDGYLVHNYLKDQPLSRNAIIDYSIKGNKDKFIIMSAISEERIVFSPYTQPQENGELRTSVNQTLVLESSVMISETTEIPEVTPGKHKRSDLYMTMPSKPVDPQDPFQPSKQEPKQISNKADVYSSQKIVTQLRMVAQNTEDLTSQEALVQLRVVTEMLRTSPQPILKEVYNQLKLAKNEPEYSIDLLAAQILFNALPHVGTEAAANQILDICTQDIKMADNCTMALNVLVLTVTPTPQIINKVINLMNREKQPEQLKQVLSLSLGSLGFKLSVERLRALEKLDKAEEMLKDLLRDNQKYIRDQVQEWKEAAENRRKIVNNIFNQVGHIIVEELKKLIEQGDTEDKILGLKSLGNSGLPQAIPVLRKILINPSEPLFLRILAVQAFRRIPQSPEALREVEGLLFNVFMNMKESSQIRNVAFSTLFNMLPDLPVLQEIADKMQNEKDAQVSSYVISVLQSFANTTFEPAALLSRNASIALENAPMYRTGLQHSFVKFGGKYSAQYKMGLSASLSSIGSMDSYESNVFRLDSVIYGLYSQLFEVGVETEAIGQMLNKLFGPKGLITMNKSVFDLLKRGRRDVSAQDIIQHIIKELGIKQRTLSFPSGSANIKIMGHELRYLDFTSNVRLLTSQGKVPISFDKDELRAGMPVDVKTMMYLLDTKLSLPTEAGFPVGLLVQASTTLNVQGSVTFKVSQYLLEEDRQGRPPVKVDSSIDLKSKVVVGLTASMGLDGFFLKPTVGFQALLKLNAPIRQDMSYDLAYHKMRLDAYVPEQESPLVEMIVQPLSEYLVITSSPQTPVVDVDIRPIYAAAGVRILPTYHRQDLLPLGLKIEISGQRPVQNAFRIPANPLSGRTVVNLFLRQLEGAPKVITLRGQYIYPLEKAVPNGYGQAYQENQASQHDAYGRDFSGMSDGTVKYDKYGRVLPSDLQDIVPPSDPIDLSQETLNMRQVVVKLQRISGKPVPLTNQRQARALILTLDASSESVTRQMQLESFVSMVNSGQVSYAMLRLWRSPIPELDNQEWQLISDFGVTYPVKTYEPQDVYSVEMQKQLLRDLDYHISFDSSKVVNQLMNLTMNGMIQQFNYPAMRQVPAFRVMDGIIPEQLYKLMNLSGSTEYTRNWQLFWSTLQPVYERVQEEVKLILDPYFTKRDSIVISDQQNLIVSQKLLLHELNNILLSKVMVHSELPVMQWVVLAQADLVSDLQEIIVKYKANGAISQVAEIEKLQRESRQLSSTIIMKVSEILNTVSTVSREMDSEGHPIIVTRPAALKKIRSPSAYTMQQPEKQQRDIYQQYSPDFGSSPSDYYMPSGSQMPSNSESEPAPQISQIDSLRLSLYNLSLFQIQVIQQLDHILYKDEDVDVNTLMSLIQESRQNITYLDSFLKVMPVFDEVVVENVLLVTVQNEFLIHLFRTYLELKPELQQLNKQRGMEIYVDHLLKVISYDLAPRASLLYKSVKISEIVEPELTEQEQPQWQIVQSIRRNLLVIDREFEMKLAKNVTAMKNPDLAKVQVEKLINAIGEYVDALDAVVENLERLPKYPTVYLTSELMEVMSYLKVITESGRQALLPMSYEQKLPWIQRLDSDITMIQSLISSMSGVFQKYVSQAQAPISNVVPILNTVPVDPRVLDIQDVLVEQTMLLKELRKFLQDKSVSNEVLQHVLMTVVERCQVQQANLKQSESQVLEALEQQQYYQRYAISSAFTKAINQQTSLYDLIKIVFEDRKNNLQSVPEMTQRVASLSYALSEMQDRVNQKLLDLQNQEAEPESPETVYNDDFQPMPDPYGLDNSKPVYEGQSQSSQSSQYQKKLVPLLPFSRLPTGITGLLNITWGNEILNKNVKLQILATRSVEQIFFLYKQLDGLIRSQDLVRAVNDKLGEEVWEADSVKDELNVYNYIHLILLFQPEQLPRYIRESAISAQEYLKYSLWQYYSRQDALSFIDQKQIQSIIEISNFNQKYDMTLMTSQESNNFVNIPLSPVVQAVTPTQNSRPMIRQAINYATGNFAPAVCMINKDKVSTFDTVSYQLPQSIKQCKKLLAMDCSPERSFAMTMIKSNASYEGQVLEIASENNVIMVVPGYLDVQVMVNGEVLKLKEALPYAPPRQLNYQLFEPGLIITRRGLRVEIELPQSGIYINVEGSFIKIQVSQLFKKKLCGLCSNFDSQRSWEYEGPAQQVYTDVQPFAVSYVIPDSACPALIPRAPADMLVKFPVKLHQRPDDSDRRREERIEDQERCEPDGATKIRPRGKRQTCFSEDAVYNCRVNCESRRVDKVQVSYRCYNNKHPKVSELKNKVDGGSILTLADFGDSGSKKSKREYFDIECEAVQFF